MRVICGRGPDREVDRVVTATMLREVGGAGEPASRAWTPHQQPAFGRRDTRAPRYDEAVAVVEERGFPAVKRSVGGRAMTYTGTTVASAHAIPLGDARSGFDARYEAGTTAVVRALRTFGVLVWRGESPASHRLGDHSAQAGGKLYGLIQRVRKEGTLVFGVVVVTDRDEIADVFAPVCEAIDTLFDPNSVGSVADADGPASSDAVCDAFEAAFVDDVETCVEDVANLV